MATDPELRTHQEWMGFLQPVGLVVSAPALVAAQAFVNRNVAREQQALASAVARVRVPSVDGGTAEAWALHDFPAFTREVLDWQPSDLVNAPGQPALPDELIIALPEYGDTLKPTYAVVDPDNAGKHLALVEILPLGVDFDRDQPVEGRRWQTTPQMRFERLLRETGVTIGLLSNGTHLRLVYRPPGESSGHVTFPVSAMMEPSGRPILGALVMLLGAERLFTLAPNQRLPSILRESRKYQNEVSTALAEQVLGALHDLLRGFQAADDATRGALLRDVLREARSEVYGGLLTVLLRLVFILYAEDRGLLADDPVYQSSYALTGLFAQLREDAARYPDTMEQRYGAWARVLVLFRLVHDGASHGAMRLPARYGRLFDPDVYPFLEGRPHRSLRQRGARVEVPKVSDGVVYRVLDSLLMLSGERLSYRALDVEQIGSVYEAMMGFALDTATGPSIAVKPQHVVVDLGTLLKRSGAERVKSLADEAGCKLPAAQAERVRSAKTVEELVAALDKRVSPRTPRVIPAGAMFLQPGEERRRSGSHYTPRSLTEPIVRTTLRPVLEALGASPRPEAILTLKVCDPAMGSGAFLVEACRALGDVLVASWQAHGLPDDMPEGEDPVLHARRLVAQRCLYGVDKNPFAVDLARLSLWLVTLAKDHPFTFLDHALRQGDSLVGLSREQIACLHWEVGKQVPMVRAVVEKAVREAEARRSEIHARAMADDVGEKRRLLDEAERALSDARVLGDCVVAAFFDAEKDSARKKRVKELADLVIGPSDGLLSQRSMLEGIARGLRERACPVTPFHWEIEFPEVFSRENGGFDAIVGNPPFLGGAKIWPNFGAGYRDWLQTTLENATAKTDLVAHFFRGAYRLLRNRGCVGFIATNSVAQGDTRESGLLSIRRAGGVIYYAMRRLNWPGMAAVVVSVIAIRKGMGAGVAVLDGIECLVIDSYLSRRGSDAPPQKLLANAGYALSGHKIYGQGFLFSDDDGATPNSVRLDIESRLPHARQVIRPYVGGEDLNTAPELAPNRWVICFGAMSLEQAQRWPELLQIVETKVRPERSKLGGYSVAEGRSERWWLFGTYAASLQTQIEGKRSYLGLCQVGAHLSFRRVKPDYILAHTAIAITLDTDSIFATLQSRPHEAWARLAGSSMKDDLRYTPSDCFETFPFPVGLLEAAHGEVSALAVPAVQRLEGIGQRYYEFRAKLMIANDEGLTATYNRFHDPEERDPGILRLRELHAEIDRAVLDAYGWTDITPRCEFLLDYEEEDEGEEESGKRRKKKPWRYRWPDEIRDEVLARLIALNGERAAEERRAGEELAKAAGTAEKSKRAPRKKKGESGEDGQGGLFG